ncbi:COP9 signalosome (CSN) subunit [Borealophlyctis nickersoniae]|nr:COP9 signalosome (CSN) subunit [Borealophlyctis nickersoniae]
MNKINAYLAKVSNAIDSENGEKLAAALRLDDDHVYKLADALGKVHNLPSVVGNRLNTPWSDIVAAHLRVVKEGILEESEEQVASLQNALAQTFHDAFTGMMRWTLPVLYTIDTDLRRRCIKADNVRLAKGDKARWREEAVRGISKAFAACCTDRFGILEKSKKWGTYRILNLLLKMYTEMNQTNLTSTILRSVANADLPSLDQFPIADQVTFKYYTGMLAFYDEQYKKAEECLSFALKRCKAKGPDTKRLAKNKMLILNYLIPTRLLCGTLPHPTLFEKYPIVHRLYGNFVLAIRNGDVRLYDESLSKKQRELIRRGTWLAVERARIVAVRVLFRKTWIIHDRTTRVPMAAFRQAMQLAGTEVDLDEVQCMLAIMIDRGYLKGYLSFEKQTVVLKNEGPFPPVASVPL